MFNKIYMYRVAVVSTHRKRAWLKDTMREIAREREREREATTIPECSVRCEYEQCRWKINRKRHL